MKLFLVLACFLLVACGETARPDSTLTGPVAVNATAVAARQTADAASVIAQGANAFASSVEGKQTAVKQSTRDAAEALDAAIARQFTIDNATASATRRLATEVSQRQNEQSTASAQRAMATASATREFATTVAQVRATNVQLQKEATATAQAQVNATATASVVAGQASATAAAMAVRAQAEADQAQWDRNFAPYKALGLALIPFALLLVILALFALAAFLGVRWYMVWEQKERIFTNDQGIVVMLPRNRWGGNAEYKYLDPPQPKQLTANVHVAEDPAQGDMVDTAPNLPDLLSVPLNLDELPHALALPLGMSHTGARYLSVNRINHVLIAGPTESGKTTLLHAFAIALLHHAVPAHLAELWLFDGKQGMKFERYQRLGARYVGDMGLPRALAELIFEMNRRYELFRDHQADSFAAYNLRDTDQLPHILFLMDELRAAFDRPGALDQVLKLMKEGREAGIHLVMATQFVEAKAIPNDVRGNAGTRIAFAVPTVHNSMAILGSSGAELLPKRPGRYLMDSGNERVELQAFTVTLPSAPIALPAAAPSSVFTDVEKKMLRLAEREGGWFKTRVIASELGMDDSRVTEVAQSWEGRGWLSVEKFNVGRRGKNGRALLDEVIKLAKKEGVLPPTFMSPLVQGMAATWGDLGKGQGDMKTGKPRVPKKVKVSG